VEFRKDRNPEGKNWNSGNEKLDKTNKTISWKPH
jgi:hypothetical protein